MPKIVDREEMRADLLAQCYGLFARKGFASVTMRDLAAALDVSTGTLYHYFENKSTLFHQMLRNLVERDTENILARIEDLPKTADRVRMLFEYIAQNEEHFRNLLFLLFDFKRHQGDTDEDAFRELLEIYRSTLIANTGLQDERLGHVILGLIVGTLVQRVVSPEDAPWSEAQSFLNETVLGT